jgi:hypothetical protein
MFGRAFHAVIFALAAVGLVSGCQNRPKIVMPTERASAAPRPRVAGQGGPVVEAPAPAADEKQTDSKKAPAKPTPPEDNK